MRSVDSPASGRTNVDRAMSARADQSARALPPGGGCSCDSNPATCHPPAGANEFAAGKPQSPPSRTRRPGDMRTPGTCASATRRSPNQIRNGHHPRPEKPDVRLRKLRPRQDPAVPRRGNGHPRPTLRQGAAGARAELPPVRLKPRAVRGAFRRRCGGFSRSRGGGPVPLFPIPCSLFPFVPASCSAARPTRGEPAARTPVSTAIQT